jgi:hypothetical protein
VGATNIFSNINQGYTVASYDPSSSGFKRLWNGFGISMKLPTSTSINYLVNKVAVTGNFLNWNDSGAYGSYQHAVQSIAEIMSKEYSISSSGLGGVLDFTQYARPYYDGMQGVSIIHSY